MSDEVFDVRADGSVVVRLSVQPAAGRSAILSRHGDALKVKVAAPPEGGRANEACASLLAEVLGVPGSAISLVAGESSRQKRFAVDGADPDDVRRALERILGPGGGKAATANPRAPRRS
ncbi:MAG TPA: DUF167 domain-containing protein [Acidimicrobiales bacterium]|nr:DUF167 domain-containing protein [Acidimicrobiales bacterium]